MPLDSVANRSKRRRLPGVDVPITQEDEVRRSLEALREHIRMYEGDSNAPKERFVTIEELELAGLVSTKLQGNFALIDSVLGNPVSQGQQSGSGTTIINETLGATTLRDLTDTAVEGATPNSFLAFQNGFWTDFLLFGEDSQWTGRQDFYGCIRINGNATNYIQICHDETDANITGANTTAINLVDLPWNMTPDNAVMWEDIDYVVVEGTTPGGAPDVDPDIGNVILLLTAGGFPINRSGGSGFWNLFPDIPGSLVVGSVDILTPGYVEPSLVFVQPRNTPDQRAVSSDQSKFSDRSFWLSGDTGLTQSYLEIRPSSGIRTSMDALTGWNLADQPFTMECHVYIPSQGNTSDASLLTVWNQTGSSDMFRWELMWNNVQEYWEVRFAFSTTGSNTINVFSQDGQMQPDQWNHIAVTRDSNDDWRFWVNGALNFGPVNVAGTIVAPNSQHYLQVMTWDDDGFATEFYMDNLRVTQGVARYTAPFTAPTAPYQGSNSTQTFVLGDVGIPTEIDGERVTSLVDFYVDGDGFFNQNATVTGVLTATTAIVGDGGNETASVSVNDATWESQLFVSNIGGTGESMLTLHQHSDTLAPIFLGLRSKANTESHTVVADNDRLLRILAGGWDGSTTYSQAAEIRFNVDGTPGNNDMPGEISFLTAADGTQTPLERMRIRADGSVEFLGPAGSGYVSFLHDDTDLTISGTNTTDINVDNSITAINFGSDVVLEWVDVEYISQGLSGPGDPFYDDIGVLLHFNGTDGATSTTDSGPNGLTPINFIGTAQLDTAQVKFGTTSLLLDGNSDYLTIADNADLKITSTDDLTIECWVRFNTLGSNVIVNKGGIAGSAWPNYTFGLTSSSEPYFFVYQNGGSNVNVISTATINTATWYHFAGTWDAATGTCELFVDGVSQGTDTNGSLVPYSTNTNDFNIGHQPSASGDYFDGWIDDLRVTFGVNRYPSNFTVPAAEFEDTQQGTSFVLGALANRALVQGTNVDIIGDVTADDTLTSVAGVWTFAQASGTPVFNIAGSLDNDPDLGQDQDAQFNFTNASGTEIGDLAWTSGPTLRIRNLVHDGNVIIAGQDSGGLDRNMIVADPSTGVELYFDTNLSARTVSSANGGLQADNTATGAGLERVLTTSDLVTGVADGTVNNSLLRWDTTAVAWEEEASWLLSDTGVLTLDEGSFGKTVAFSHDGFDYNIVPGINTRDIVFGDTTGDGDFSSMRVTNCNVIITDTTPATSGVNIGSRLIGGVQQCEFLAIGSGGAVLTGEDWIFSSSGNTDWFRVGNSSVVATTNMLEFGTDNTAEIMRYVGREGGSVPYYFDIRIIEDVATTGEVAMRIKNNNTEFARFDVGTGTNFFRLLNAEFRHEQTTSSLSWDRYFSGALAITDFTNVTDWRIQGLSGDVEIMDGRGLTCVSAGGSNAVAVRHDGTDVNWTHAVTTDWNISGLTNVRLNDVGLAIGNAGETADVVFAHDGTDLNITETGTDNITFPAAGTLGLDMVDNTILTPILQDWATQFDAPTVSANAVTLDYTLGPMFEVDLEPATATVTVTVSGGPPSGTHGRIRVKFQQDGTTAQALSWAGGTFRWDGGTAHTMNTTLDGISIYTLETWDGGTTWYASGADYS